jgi:hypothetical protein
LEKKTQLHPFLSKRMSINNHNIFYVKNANLFDIITKHLLQNRNNTFIKAPLTWKSNQCVCGLVHPLMGLGIEIMMDNKKFVSFQLAIRQSDRTIVVIYHPKHTEQIVPSTLHKLMYCRRLRKMIMSDPVEFYHFGSWLKRTSVSSVLLMDTQNFSKMNKDTLKTKKSSNYDQFFQKYLARRVSHVREFAVSHKNLRYFDVCFKEIFHEYQKENQKKYKKRKVMEQGEIM